ncbi:nucleoporin nup61, partial [Cladorrhinum sp. PSN259]
MDPPSKKRSLFGFTNLFRPSPSAEDTEMKNDIPVKSTAPALPRPSFNSASAPESPAKRASESQMANRKIMGRPHGPSSGLSQSMSATDPSRPSSSNAVAAPRRMPGDNPNKPSTYSTTLVSRATTSELRATNFSGANSSSTPRSNIFRSSALYSRPPATNFSSRAPSNSLNQSFPQTTPGRGSRASTAEFIGRAVAPPSSSELFKMRIQSPPRELTGEKMAKEVPDDMNRTGSVYADEFLAHYCPPELDEQQRRQFFCILDLRRLKYAADEVFTKKDWKINILNFAKEYEKSRSLIMLRYGLYEFKTVRASEAVKKEWKAKNGIPDSDDEDGDVAMTNGGVKRKAEEELTPKAATSAFTASVLETNKRVRALELSAKNKRKADAVGEPDEEAHPAKLQRPTSTPQKTASATKSMFESIANKSFTPAKSTNSLFGSMAEKPVGRMAEKPKRSIFDSSPKSAPSSNIFGHLSDASKGSGNEGADEGSDTDSASEYEDSQVPDASQSEEPASSGETATPQFGAKANGTSSASSDAGESTQGSTQGSFQGRSIFERITRGTDGQPVRKLPPQEGRSLFAAPADKERSASPVKELPTPAAPAPASVSTPSNKTWDPSAGIKFSTPSTAPTNNLFASTATKPAAPAPPKDSAPPTSLFAKKPEGAPAASSLFGAPAKKDEEATSSSETTPKAPAASLFSSSFAPASSDNTPKASSTNLFASSFTPKADPPATSAPSFGGFKPTTASSSSLFGSTATSFGQSTAKDEKKDTAPAPATSSLFGAKPADAAAEPAKPGVFQSSTLFGSQGKTDSAPAAQPSNLFGQSTTAAAPADKSSGSSLFGATNGTAAPKPAVNLFSSVPVPATATEAPKFTFGSTDAKPTSSLFSSAASTPAPETAGPAQVKNLFGGITTSAAPATETKSLFGTTAPAATETKNLFGGPLFGASPAAETKPLFGGAAPATETKSLFGNVGASTPATESKPLFGSTTQADSKPPASLFANPTPSTTAPAASSNIFSFGGSQPAAPAPAATSFNFGASQPAATQSTAPAGSSIFGNAGGGSSFSFTAGGGGNTAASFTNPFASGQDGPPTAPTSFNFGVPEPAASQSFTFGSNTTGANNTATIPTFSFGGASDTNASAGAPSAIFSFGGGASQNPTAAPIFGNSLAPGGGTSTGTNTPFTFGGASSLATTPAASTPEPSATVEAAQGTNADGDEPQQEQISLTKGGQGEEDEQVVHEIRAKALKFVTGKEKDDDESSATDKEKKPGWVIMGVGPLRLLKHKETGSVRILLRAEPRGHIALNKRLLPEITYKADAKRPNFVSIVTATDDGKGLEKWTLQVKTKELAEKLIEALEENKKANEK